MYVEHFRWYPAPPGIYFYQAAAVTEQNIPLLLRNVRSGSIPVLTPSENTIIRTFDEIHPQTFSEFSS